MEVIGSAMTNTLVYYSCYFIDSDKYIVILRQGINCSSKCTSSICTVFYLKTLLWSSNNYKLTYQLTNQQLNLEKSECFLIVCKLAITEVSDKKARVFVKLDYLKSTEFERQAFKSLFEISTKKMNWPKL